ncbi:MAG: aspartate aminotransferase family protein [Pirellulaceae bacterium]|nr:aspartate aminotransferase family protein [Pirellulaceae bacterium]
MSIAHQFAVSLPQCDHQPRRYTGPSRDEVWALRQRYLNPGLLTYYQRPLMLVEGYMQYLFDDAGQRYLDLFAGIVSVSCGHCHPKIVQRVQQQVGLLPHATTIYLHPNVAELGAKLAAKLPAGLEVAYFTNSGSEANDLAILMARLYTGQRDVIALRNGYHGGSGITMSITSHHTWKYEAAATTSVYHAAAPDPYRSLFSGDADQVARDSVADLRQVIQYSTTGKLAAFIAEPIQGVGGTTAGAPSYLPQAYQAAREHGGLCIADEVQTGFGRTGEHYWGFQNYSVVPDIVTMAKSLGNGAPIGAVVTRPEIADTMRQRLHVNTFGGNPVSTAAALAVLDVIDEDGLQENARQVGGYFKDQLLQLQDKYEIIGDVRGLGLMLGVELVTDRSTKQPAREQTARLHEMLRECSVLVGKGGLYGNVLRIKPPLCITRADVDYAIAAIDYGLSQL